MYVTVKITVWRENFCFSITTVTDAIQDAKFKNPFHRLV